MDDEKLNELKDLSLEIVKKATNLELGVFIGACFIEYLNRYKNVDLQIEENNEYIFLEDTVKNIQEYDETT